MIGGLALRRFRGFRTLAFNAVAALVTAATLIAPHLETFAPLLPGDLAGQVQLILGIVVPVGNFILRLDTTGPVGRGGG